MPLIGLKNMIVAGPRSTSRWAPRSPPGSLARREMHCSAHDGALGALAIVGLAGGASRLRVRRQANGLGGVPQRQGAHRRRPRRSSCHADGRTATVDLIANRDGTLSIATNGKTDAAINMARALGDPSFAAGADEFTMTLLGALPLAYAPDARRAAVIGHGSGLTTHVVLGSPVIERVDVIEIEPEMIRAARAFGPRVARAYDDPRAHSHRRGCARVLRPRARAYDIVVSEPSNPWVSGVASLFTPEFYRLARRSLAPGGVFVQWFQVYEFDRALIGSIVRNLGAEFGDYVLYAANGSDMLVIASASGPVPPVTDALFGWPGTRVDLA